MDQSRSALGTRKGGKDGGLNAKRFRKAPAEPAVESCGGKRRRSPFANIPNDRQTSAATISVDRNNLGSFRACLSMKSRVDDRAAGVESDQREAKPEIGILKALVDSVKMHPPRTGASCRRRIGSNKARYMTQK